MPVSAKPRPASKRARRMAREPRPKPEEHQAYVLPSPSPRITKAQIVLDLLQRPEGSALDGLMEATGWQAHTTRAVLTSLRKKGHLLTSWKPETSARIYRIVMAEGEA